jgi:hypothetical protein
MGMLGLMNSLYFRRNSCVGCTGTACRMNSVPAQPPRHREQRRARVHFRRARRPRIAKDALTPSRK